VVCIESGKNNDIFYSILLFHSIIKVGINDVYFEVKMSISSFSKDV